MCTIFEPLSGLLTPLRRNVRIDLADEVGPQGITDTLRQVLRVLHAGIEDDREGIAVMRRIEQMEATSLQAMEESVSDRLELQRKLT